MTIFNGDHTIFTQRRSYYTPNTTFRFYVRFYNEFAAVDDALLQLLSDEIISVDLPKYSDKIYTRNFLNTYKSYTIGRDTTGTSTIKFNIRVADNPLYDILSMKLLDYNFNTANSIVERSYFEKYRMFNRVEITILPNSAEFGSQKQVTLQNVLVTDINFDPLNYETEGKLTGSMVLHYDAFFWSEIDHYYTGNGQSIAGQLLNWP